MSDSIVRTPWKDYMGEVPMHLEYFDGSMFEAVEQIAKKYPATSLLRSWESRRPTAR